MRRVLILAGLLAALASPSFAQVTGCPTASTSLLGCVKPDGTSVTISSAGVISAPTAGGGNVTGTGTTVVGTVPLYTNTAATGIGPGLPVGTSGNSTLVETTSGGLLNPAILPLATSSAFGAVKVDGTTITASSGVISASGSGVSSISGTAGQITASASTGAVTLSLPSTITANETFSGTITFSGTVTGTALSTYLASPPAIGGTTAAAGAFTTLSASSTVTGGGFTNLFASPPSIGNSAAASGAFTTLSASSTVTMSGISAGTQTTCLGLDSSNHIVGSGASCGSGSGGITALTGDVTASGSGSVAATIATNAVTLAKFQQGTALTVVANPTSGTANDQNVPLGSGLAFCNNTTLCPQAPDRTSTVTATVGNGDMSGIVVMNGSSLTLNIPAITSGPPAILTTGMSVAWLNRNSSALTLSSSPTLNGLPSTTTVHQFGWADCVSNNTSLDCIGFPGFGTITTNALSKFIDGSGATTASSLTDNGTIISASESVDVTSNGIVAELPNDTSTGTSLNLLVSLTGAGTAILTANGATDGVIGICTGNCGKSGSAQITKIGQASCTFDGATTANDYVSISATLGKCHDNASSRPTGTQVIGRVLSTNGAGGTYAMWVDTSYTNAAGGGSGTVASSTIGQIPVYTGATTVTGNANITFSGSTLTVGTSGATGALSIVGTSSGNATITVPSAAGTPTITLGSSSGTPAVTASSPLAITTATGNITCATCATTTNGGALSGTSPVAISAAGAISITGAANQVLAGSTPAFTATPTLGTNGGTGGSITLNGSTSGSVIIQTAAAAGTSTKFQLPATNGSSTDVLQTDGAGVTSWVAPGGGGSTTIVAPQGRLTLTTATPVMTANTTGVSQVFYDCYLGNQVPYYTGSADALDTIASCEVSLTMATSGTGVANNADNFDVWWVHGGASRVCIATNGSGGGWASDTGGSTTARGTGYSQLDKTSRPYITIKNSITHCYNGATDYGSVSANQATLLGTLTTTAAGQTGMNFLAGVTLNPVAVLGLSNAYNQVPVIARIMDNTSSWSYGTNAWRAANGSGNTISWVDSVQASSVIARYQVVMNGSGSHCVIGVSLDAATPAQLTNTDVGSGNLGLSTEDVFLPQIGLHKVGAEENSPGASSTCTFIGSFGAGQDMSFTARLNM